jgi:hypothetical protein
MTESLTRPGLLHLTSRVHSYDMRESIVQHGEYRIRVKSCGPSDGPHAVLLPGMGATAVALAPQARAFRALGYTTHIVELPLSSCRALASRRRCGRRTRVSRSWRISCCTSLASSASSAPSFSDTHLVVG